MEGLMLMFNCGKEKKHFYKVYFLYNIFGVQVTCAKMSRIFNRIPPLQGVFLFGYIMT